MAGLRNALGICPSDVLDFLMDLFKYNDNSKNRYSDNYYRAALIEALGATVTPFVAVQQGYIQILITNDVITINFLNLLLPLGPLSQQSLYPLRQKPFLKKSQET
jgi:hypothetical protein